MCSVEGSPLSILFSGKWDGRFIRDQDSRVFVDMDPRAFEQARNALFEGQEGVDHLLCEAHKRQFTGVHDFWFKLLLSPLPPVVEEKRSAERPQLTATNIPPELNAFWAAVKKFIEGFAARKGRLARERQPRRRHTTRSWPRYRRCGPSWLPCLPPIRSCHTSARATKSAQWTCAERLSPPLRPPWTTWATFLCAIDSICGRALCTEFLTNISAVWWTSIAASGTLRPAHSCLWPVWCCGGPTRQSNDSWTRPPGCTASLRVALPPRGTPSHRHSNKVCPVCAGRVANLMIASVGVCRRPVCGIRLWRRGRD
mmetsp:Transcript_32843/g.94785  ORF Transcript_32843/g.94785 Transcript_32843/m.94785 type:complete len:312 (-) Transcript_32843:342-1277(-)